MDNEEYSRLSTQAYERSRQGDPRGASAAFESLAGDPALTDLPADRAILFYNAAVCIETAGPAPEVERLYDAAIAIERQFCIERSRAGKASWLTRAGRPAQAAELYRDLLSEPWLLWAKRLEYEGYLARLTA